MAENKTNTAQDNVVAHMPGHITDRVYNWCQAKDSVSSLMAADPNLTPGEAWKTLFGKSSSRPSSGGKGHDGDKQSSFKHLTAEELDRARQCGKWGSSQPSDLFLRMYHDALCTLNDDPGRAMVSPPLMGSSGTAPLAVISVIPDIARHMSNLIVRAKKEVFLATNFWASGVATTYITNAIRELSKRAGERGERVVMKVLYDRGNPKQLIDPHHFVPESEYVGGAVKLPAKADIPHVDLQVMNFHQPLLGTFHAKYMVVDRQFAVLQSDNLQESDNLEMMVHLEGPIVDSLYDMAMISWHKKLDPPMPLRNTPAATSKEPPSFTQSLADIFSPDGAIKGHSAITDSRKLQPRQAYGLEDTSNAHAQSGSTPASALSRFDSDSAKRLPEHTTEDPNYDVDIAGEVARVQEAVSAKPGVTTRQAVTKHLNHTINVGFEGDAPECAPIDEMTPYIPHLAQEPVPMALVCRPPYGAPTHNSVVNPQNAAWLSALRNAKKNVFIQTPTLNAKPLVPAIIDACERGIDVYCYICLGYNDAGELLPGQGGHNDMIANKLYTKLSPSGRTHLKWHWYVAKDQTKPVHAGQKKRSCHIKLMIVDEHIAIQGNGNQDTQSWYHSQEINVMIDSAPLCRAWIEGIRRNQNTGAYGAVSTADGIWRDEHGKMAEGAMGPDAGHFAFAKGVVGAIKRVQGTGGF
ncbi:phospholipase D/nuclease [Xylariaceae sp. FL0255]|nr:phospholipase D/nuclease [Xylariaceae sp. FL0255]